MSITPKSATDIDRLVGLRITALRKARGLSQTALGTADSKPRHTPGPALRTGLAAFFRRNVDVLTVEVLDLYRRYGEDAGAAIIAGDLTGDELAAICDHEIAGRYVALTGERDALGSEGR